MATVFAQAQIDEHIQQQAVAVLADMGLTVSDFMRIALTQVAQQKTIPFELPSPPAQQQAKAQLRQMAQHSSLADVLSPLDDAWSAMQ